MMVAVAPVKCSAPRGLRLQIVALPRLAARRASVKKFCKAGDLDEFNTRRSYQVCKPRYD